MTQQWFTGWRHGQFLWRETGWHVISNGPNVAGDTVIPKRGKSLAMKIYHRFHFASSLKRMSVIAGHSPPGSVDTEYVATVKGAPETLRPMVTMATT